MSAEPSPPSLSRLAAYFLRLGTFGFGGPISLAGYMQRDLVERRGWISLDDFKQGLALAQLAPGPLAAQLAIYLGWAVTWLKKLPEPLVILVAGAIGRAPWSAR